MQDESVFGAQPSFQSLALLFRKRTYEDRRFHESHYSSSHTTYPEDALVLPNLLSVVLIVAGIAALHVKLRSIYGRLGTAGFVLASVGAAVLVVSGASWLWELVGAVALLLGSLLIGVAVLVANAPLRWGAIALVVGSLAFFFYNTEDGPYSITYAERLTKHCPPRAY